MVKVINPAIGNVNAININVTSKNLSGPFEYLARVAASMVSMPEIGEIMS